MLQSYERGFAVMTKELDAFSFELSARINCVNAWITR